MSWDSVFLYIFSTILVNRVFIFYLHYGFVSKVVTSNVSLYSTLFISIGSNEYFLFPWSIDVIVMRVFLCEHSLNWLHLVIFIISPLKYFLEHFPAEHFPKQFSICVMHVPMCVLAYKFITFAYLTNRLSWWWHCLQHTFFIAFSVVLIVSFLGLLPFLYFKFELNWV